MSANFIPNQSNYKELGQFKAWCQKVLPLVYEDSVSYYELLGKVLHYLNETIANMNLMGTDISELYNTYALLVDWVNTYFESLDVQNEINSKLDEMATDGTLSYIILEYLNVAITFDTTEKLKSVDKLAKGMYVATKGYYEVGDNGGANFVITDTPNNDVYYVQLANGLYAQHVHTGVGLNVCQLGLTNGKYVNDYWVECVKYARYLRTHLYFPYGTYHIKNGSNNIGISDRFISMRGEMSIIKADASFNNSTKMFVFSGNDVRWNGFIEGLKFESYYETFSDTLNFIQFDFNVLGDIFYNFKLKDCVFGKNYGYSVTTNGFSNGGFNNCEITSCTFYGLALYLHSFGDSNKIGKNSFYGSEEVQLNNNVIDIQLASGSACLTVDSNNCTSGLGIIRGEKCTVSNNQVENTTQTGINYLLRTEGRGSCVMNNNFNGHELCDLLQIVSADGVIISNAFIYPKQYDIISVDHVLKNYNSYFGAGVHGVNGYVCGFKKYVTNGETDEVTGYIVLGNDGNMQLMSTVADRTMYISPVAIDTQFTPSADNPMQKVSDIVNIGGVETEVRVTFRTKFSASVIGGTQYTPVILPYVTF